MMRKFITSLLMLSALVSWGQNASIDDISKLYQSQEFKLVIEKGMPLLQADSNNVDLNLMIGRTYADQREFKKALPFLEFTAKNADSWQKAWALTYLGTCYFMEQRYDESKISIDDCIRLNATQNVTNSAFGKSLIFGFNEFYQNWKIVDTDHFRFHFQNMNTADIEKYTSIREKAYQEINDFFKGKLPKKIDFYVWESREDARKILRGNLGFAKPEFCIVHTHFQQTIGHEMTHVISNYTSEITNKTRFINEGTAVCFDRTHQDRFKQVKDWMAANNKPIVVMDCWANGNDYAEEILYPLSGLFVKELIDHFGKEKFLEFFKIQTYEHAKLVFGDQLDDVIKEFENKINT